MKVFALNHNGVLDGVMEVLGARGQLTTNYHECDIFLLWQDVRGECRELARIAKESLGKPVVVMQHGRGATRDYCPPNSFQMLADKILVWGKSEEQRLLKQGVSADRIEIVGCPLFPKLKPKAKQREGVNILFCPVIAEKEEPENILVYAALKEWESQRLIKTIQLNFNSMKSGWATEENNLRDVVMPDGKVERRLWHRNIIPRIPRYITYGGGMVNVKLTGIHDQFQYMAPVIGSSQADAGHIESTVDALCNTDVLVCLEEGTMQLLACALDIPIIHVDIFKYGTYGGTKDYDRIELIKTPACYRTTKIEKIGGLLDRALSSPAELRQERINVCECEGGASMGDINANVVRALESVLRVPVKA